MAVGMTLHKAEHNWDIFDSEVSVHGSEIKKKMEKGNVFIGCVMQAQFL